LKTLSTIHAKNIKASITILNLKEGFLKVELELSPRQNKESNDK
jgi:hypothetical protein